MILEDRFGDPSMNEEIVPSGVSAALFDFGGVIAEEGFREGLYAIAQENGLDRNAFFGAVDAIIYECGYLTGMADEAAFWQEVRNRTGARGDDEVLRREILRRFVLRPAMIAVVDSLRRRGTLVALLSDQTNWLDEIDRANSLFRHFDRVFNSYHIRKSKRDASIFREVCAALAVEPRDTLFIDDNADHIGRARGQGLQTLHFVGFDDFRSRLERIFAWQPTGNR